MQSLNSMEQNTITLHDLSSRQCVSTSNADWRSEWQHDLSEIMRRCEEAEQRLSYASPCASEELRKGTGSYYTPADTTDFFWREFFEHSQVADEQACAEFWRTHHFIEPSAGAGILVFGLLKQAVSAGLPFAALQDLEISIVDINDAALGFIEEQIGLLCSRWNIEFPKLRLVCADFREYMPGEHEEHGELEESSRVPLVFGNPPFVANPSRARWKNRFADFVEHSLFLTAERGAMHFILPLSVSFSRDYMALRSALLERGSSVFLANFDNIPDCLFPSGKPNSSNTNKSNSQRITILTVLPSEERRVASTMLQRWSRSDRQRFLSVRPHYHDVTDFDFDKQIPRPENAEILAYLNRAKGVPRLGLMLTRSGRYQLHVATVARNFIGIREDAGSAVNSLACDSEDGFLMLLGVLASDLFLAYWRTVGDGFHITKSNLLNFPVDSRVKGRITENRSRLQQMWEERGSFAKHKRHPNGVSVSYDFGGAAPSLLGDSE